MRPSSSRTFNALPESEGGRESVRKGETRAGVGISAFAEFLIGRERLQKIGTVRDNLCIWW